MQLKNINKNGKLLKSNTAIFIFYWLLAFIMYLPARKAGWVGDFFEWYEKVKTLDFVSYINWNISEMAELYQFTQLVTYCFYRLFGVSTFPWHLLHLTIHVFNCFLLYIICKKLFIDSGIKNSLYAAFFGALLFLISPQVSEAVIYKPAFHFLLAFTFILVIISCLQQYLSTKKVLYAWVAGIVFLLSTHSLELFILTPLFVSSIGIYYYLLYKQNEDLKQLFLGFLLPEMIGIGLYFLWLRLAFPNKIPHNATLFTMADYAGKSWKYIFHILFFGRYFEPGIKNNVYTFLDSKLAIYAFYFLFISLIVFTVFRYKQLRQATKLKIVLTYCCLIPMIILSMNWFPNLLLIVTDRYPYVLVAFLFMLLILFIIQIPNRVIRYTLLIIYALVNIYFTIKVNLYWRQSSIIMNTMEKTFPEPGNKILLILNEPYCLNGAIIFRAMPNCEFVGFYNLYHDKKILNTAYDIAAYNMVTANDGAHVNVLNDTTVEVTLNQWGTWWWYDYQGCTSRETKDYKLDMVDAGHRYKLILKKDAKEYLLLYQNNKQFKTVNWDLKNTNQY